MRKAEIFKAAAGLKDEIYDKPHKEICSKYANAGQRDIMRTAGMRRTYANIFLSLVILTLNSRASDPRARKTASAR